MSVHFVSLSSIQNKKRQVLQPAPSASPKLSARGSCLRNSMQVVVRLYWCKCACKSYPVLNFICQFVLYIHTKQVRFDIDCSFVGYCICDCLLSYSRLMIIISPHYNFAHYHYSVLSNKKVDSVIS